MTVAELSQFSIEQQRAVLELVDFMADRIGLPGWEDAIRNGLDSLAREAQALWPTAEEGKRVDLGVKHLGGHFEGVANETEAMQFVAVAGYILLNGQDGPLATAAPMRNTIDFLAARHKGEA